MMPKWIAWVIIMAIVGLIALSMLGALIRVASAQPYRGPMGTACGDYATVVEYFDQVAGKVLVARGLGLDGKVIEVMASDGGEFVILVVRPDKWTCAIRQGAGWTEIVPFLKEDKRL